MNVLLDNLVPITGGVGVTILLFLLKRIPNDKIKALVEGIFYKLGVVCTLGLGKWKITKKYWNNIIEPYFVDLLDNTVNSALKGFVEGLRSDNE
jgi:hypothetical protein